MAAYTSGGDKLHMCYTFDFLSPIFSARHFRERIEAFEAIVGDGWPCWAFSNHDIVRHVSRWADATALSADQLAKLAAGILLSLRGSVCLYQGEELGLTEAELRFEDLADPYGIRFWPEFKGRDGCRTPMVWESNAPNGGFTTGKPWLPVSGEHISHAVNRAGRRRRLGPRALPPRCSPSAARIRRSATAPSPFSTRRRTCSPSCARAVASGSSACSISAGRRRVSRCPAVQGDCAVRSRLRRRA